MQLKSKYIFPCKLLKFPHFELPFGQSFETETCRRQDHYIRTKVPTSVAETDTHENKVRQLECIVRASSMCGLLVIKKQFQTHYTCLKMEDWHERLSYLLDLRLKVLVLIVTELMVTSKFNHLLFTSSLTSFVCDNCLKKSNKTRKENKYAAKSKCSNAELPAHFMPVFYGPACLFSFTHSFHPFAVSVLIPFSFGCNTNTLRLRLYKWWIKILFLLHCSFYYTLFCHAWFKSSCPEFSSWIHEVNTFSLQSSMEHGDM